MYNYKYAANSFTNEWQDIDNGDFPSGVILDVSITTPRKGSVHITRLSTDGKSVSLELSQNGELIAWGNISDCVVPSLLNCSTGVYASVLLGYIPDNLTFAGDCKISPQRVTYYTPTNNIQAKRLILTQGDTTEQFDLTSDLSVVLGAGLRGSASDGVLTVSVTDKIILDSTEKLTSTLPNDRIITTINGASVLEGEGAVALNISYRGTLIPVSQYSSGIVILDTSVVPACSSVDIIDSYIGPDTPHDGYTFVLDEAYTSDGVRDTKLLELRKYGWSGDLNLISIDPAFDVVEVSK